MPFDLSGNYTLPSPEFPLIPNTLADANVVNTIFSDVRTALGQTLLRSGVAAMTGALKLADGSQASPSLTFGGEVGLGVYRKAAGQLALVAANTELSLYTSSAITFRIPVAFEGAPTYAADPGSANVLTRKSYVDAAIASAVASGVAGYLPLTGGTLSGPGNLTVGGTLDTLGSARTRGDLFVYGTGDRLNVFPQTAGNGVNVVSTNNANSGYSSLALEGSLLKFNISGAERMRLDTSGNLGVGAVSGGERLHVAGNAYFLRGAGAVLRLADSNNEVRISSVPVAGDSALAFYTQAGTNERLRIDPSGNVGVGTASPGARLDIAGGGSSLRIRADGSDLGRLQFTDAAASVSYAFVGTPAANALAFYTNGLNERIRIDASGNVGIGNTPVGSNRLLEVGSSSRATTYVRAVAQTAGSAWFEALSASSDTFLAGLNFSGGSITGFPSGCGGVMMAGANPLILGTSAAERMRIDSAGDVGIGTTVPGGWRLNVTGGSVAAPGNSSVLRLRNAGDGGIALNFDNNVANLARIVGGVTGTGAGTDDGVLTFETSVNGSLNERMRIASNGDVGIGNTASSGYKLHVSGTASASSWNIGTQVATDSGYLGFSNSQGSGVGIWGNSSAQSGALQLLTNGTERLRITSAGAVTIGGTLTVGGLEVGYRKLPPASVTSGAFAASDSGKCVFAIGGVTIPNSTFAQGDVVVIQNLSTSAITITKSITNAYYTSTNTTLGATFSVPARGRISILFQSGTECYVSGDVA